MLTSCGRLSVHAGDAANRRANMKHSLAVPRRDVRSIGRVIFPQRCGRDGWWGRPRHGQLKTQRGNPKPSPCRQHHISTVSFPYLTLVLGFGLSVKDRSRTKTSGNQKTGMKRDKYAPSLSYRQGAFRRRLQCDAGLHWSATSRMSPRAKDRRRLSKPSGCRGTLA